MLMKIAIRTASGSNAQQRCAAINFAKPQAFPEAFQVTHDALEKTRRLLDKVGRSSQLDI